MPRKRTPTQAAAGKLVSAVQRVWTAQLGEVVAKESEQVMHRAHDLLGAVSRGDAMSVLESRSVIAYLGNAWVRAHPEVMPCIIAFEQALALETDAQPRDAADRFKAGSRPPFRGR
jgi:hypothetical protein